MKDAAESLAFDNSIIILWQNNFLLIVDIFLVALFAIYVARKINDSAKGWRETLCQDATKIAWALGIGYLGLLTNRMWLLLRYHDLGNESLYSAMAVVSLAMAVCSASFVLSVFSGVAWGRRMWLWIIVIAAIGSVVLIIQAP